jgi:putative PIN family toxin of toxin-antitoxin system
VPVSKPRAFLDTNVIFSGLHSPRGAPGAILEYYVNARITAVISQQVLEEVVRTVHKKLPQAASLLKTMLTNAPPEIVADASFEALKPLMPNFHIADAAILAAAISAKPDFFVTGDSDFLRNRGIIEEAGLHIVTPAEFVRQLT